MYFIDVNPINNKILFLEESKTGNQLANLSFLTFKARLGEEGSFLGIQVLL